MDCLGQKIAPQGTLLSVIGFHKKRYSTVSINKFVIVSIKKIASVLFLFFVFNAQVAFSSGHEAAKVSSPPVLQSLLEGNKGFAQKGEFRTLGQKNSLQRRAELAIKQNPFAVVITCSDSRVSPEIIFDKGHGEIFVVRVAGNIVGPHEPGSVEYAVEHLGAKLVMVLGHERCGAVTATYDAHLAGGKVEGNIGSIVEAIDPAVTAAISNGATGIKAEIIEQCIVQNIRLVASEVETRSPILKEAIASGHVQLVKAYFDLDNGKVSVID